jgi:hypothetical protein
MKPGTEPADAKAKNPALCGVFSDNHSTATESLRTALLNQENHV